MKALRHRAAGAALTIAMVGALAACGQQSAPSAVAPKSTPSSSSSDTSASPSSSTDTSSESSASTASTPAPTSGGSSGGGGGCQNKYDLGGEATTDGGTKVQKFGQPGSAEGDYSLKYTVTVQPGVVQDPAAGDYVDSGFVIATFKVHIALDTSAADSGMTAYQSFTNFELYDATGAPCAADSITQLIPDNDPINKGSTMSSRTTSIDGMIAYDVPKGTNLSGYTLAYSTDGLSRHADLAWKG